MVGNETSAEPPHLLVCNEWNCQAISLGHVWLMVDSNNPYRKTAWNALPHVYFFFSSLCFRIFKSFPFLSLVCWLVQLFLIVEAFEHLLQIKSAVTRCSEKRFQITCGVFFPPKCLKAKNYYVSSYRTYTPLPSPHRKCRFTECYKSSSTDFFGWAATLVWHD